MSCETVFFSRCLPREADIIDIAIRERRLFIGWSAWRPGIERDRRKLRDCIVDLHCSDDDWWSLRPTLGEGTKNFSANRNLVREIQPGAIALIARPKRGVVYAGRVTASFEVIDDPPWADEYLALRERHGLDGDTDANLVADVAHSCSVDEFKPIPFPLIPAWI